MKEIIDQRKITGIILGGVLFFIGLITIEIFETLIFNVMSATIMGIGIIIFGFSLIE